jgi:hypothetical protein
MNDRIADFTNNRFYTRLGEVGKNVLKDWMLIRFQGKDCEILTGRTHIRKPTFIVKHFQQIPW